MLSPTHFIVFCACVYTGMVMVHLEGGLGCVDVFPSSSVACIYLTGDQATAQLGPTTRARMAALAKVYISLTLLLCLWSPLSPQETISKSTLMVQCA